MRLKEKSISPEYLCHYLKSNTARTKLVESGAGANIKSLSQGALSSLEIPLPPLATQQTLVSHLDRTFSKLDALLAGQRTRLGHLEAMKGSILGEAFRGRL